MTIVIKEYVDSISTTFMNITYTSTLIISEVAIITPLGTETITTVDMSFTRTILL